MLLYSQTISAFLSRVRNDVREIVNNEMHLKMDKSRVHFQGISYALTIVVFEDQRRLGYFDSKKYEIGLSKKLMYQAKDQVLKNIIRHELAHLMCALTIGPHIQHSKEYHEVCARFNWGPEVYSAYANLEQENREATQPTDQNLQTEKLLERLKKLLALSSSDNIHERELATLKANQLLLEHNLDLAKLQRSHFTSTNDHDKNQDEEIIYLKRSITAPRKTAKHVAIYAILETFFVSPVFNNSYGIFYIEIIGDKTSVELADYVAHFLNRELDTLWKETQKENPNLRGLASKNSFFRGIAKGYVAKIKNQKNSAATSFDLMTIEKNLQLNLQTVYPRLSQSYSSGIHSKDGYEAGIIKGSNLSIKPGIANKSSQIFFLT